MARFWRIQSNGNLAYNFDICEEVVLIDSYLKVCAFVTPSDLWRTEFESFFFVQGKGVAASFIDTMNSLLQKHNFIPFEIRETDVSEYGKVRDESGKMQKRNEVKRELESMDDEARRKLVEHTRAEAARLPPPHQPFAEYEVLKAERDRMNEEESQISRDEASRRRAAVEAQQAKAPAPLTVAEAATILDVFADDDGMCDEIITKLPRAALLELAKQVQEKSLKTRIGKRILALLS